MRGVHEPGNVVGVEKLQLTRWQAIRAFGRQGQFAPQRRERRGHRDRCVSAALERHTSLEHEPRAELSDVRGLALADTQVSVRSQHGCQNPSSRSVRPWGLGAQEYGEGHGKDGWLALSFDADEQWMPTLNDAEYFDLLV